VNWRNYSKSASSKGVPTTYLLPDEYSTFKTHHENSPNKLWIVKPGDKARGIGIFIIDSLLKIPNYLRDGTCTNNEQLPSWSKGTFVISEYISNPWLINSKKFDLRIYVLVTHIHPDLNVYIYKQGFARFCTENYSLDPSSLKNTFVHLTNVAMNQLNVSYVTYKFHINFIEKRISC
jgi:tubulin polyglutamylase TTLL1